MKFYLSVTKIESNETKTTRWVAPPKQHQTALILRHIESAPKAGSTDLPSPYPRNKRSEQNY